MRARRKEELDDLSNNRKEALNFQLELISNLKKAQIDLAKEHIALQESFNSLDNIEIYVNTAIGKIKLNIKKEHNIPSIIDDEMYRQDAELESKISNAFNRIKNLT